MELDIHQIPNPLNNLPTSIDSEKHPIHHGEIEDLTMIDQITIVAISSEVPWDPTIPDPTGNFLKVLHSKATEINSLISDIQQEI
jgi:hypothetical protein